MPDYVSSDNGQWIRLLIEEYIAESPENTLKNEAEDKAFEMPLIGFSNGADSLYEDYRRWVGEFHWTPLEAFKTVFPETKAKPGDLTVISWILPHIKATKTDNRAEKIFPSERWARARIFGEEVNVKLRQHVIAALRDRDIEAAAPQLSPVWKEHKSDSYTFASTWSERHAAFAAGLGTFGLCDGLITSRGKAIRIGSVIARMVVIPNKRHYKSHTEYCLFHTYGTCGKCIARCPVGALSEKGHDKKRCLAHLKPPTKEHVKAAYGFDGYGCGLCQTGVPCESRIPKKTAE